MLSFSAASCDKKLAWVCHPAMAGIQFSLIGYTAFSKSNFSTSVSFLKNRNNNMFPVLTVVKISGYEKGTITKMP